MYHRVLPPGAAIDGLNKGIGVSQDLFEQHIRCIAEKYRFLRLDDLPGHMRNKEPMGVVITFDDGYRDTLELALPVLEKYSVPATVFVSTCYPDGDCRVWWFELSELLHQYTNLHFFWKRRDFDMPLRNKTEKSSAFKVLRDLMLDGLSPTEQDQLMTLIRQGRTPRQYDHLFMDWDMLRQLAAHPCISIGAHTMGHVSLSGLDEAGARAEIMGSKKRLEEMLQCDIVHMAYPFGSLREAGPREYALTDEFSTAVTTRSGVVRSADSLHALPRLSASQKDDVLRLAFKLGGVFSALNRIRWVIAKQKL